MVEIELKGNSWLDYVILLYIYIQDVFLNNTESVLVFVDEINLG